MTSLLDFPLNPSLLRALDGLGFENATDVQIQAIPKALEGCDLLVSAKTGSGKTVAFLLPTLEQLLNNKAPNTSTRALILVPTRELALQIKKICEQLARFTPIKCGLVMGGESFGHQVSTIRRNPEILIATPGRLVEHIKNNTTDFSDLEILILDEAEQMLDMGFAEDMNLIAESCKPDRQNLLFSATLKHKKIAEVSSILNNPTSIVVDTLRQVPNNICQQAILADDDKHKKELVRALISEQQSRKILIFCNTRAQCQQLGNFLKSKNIKANFIHGEVCQSDRKQIINQFRNNNAQILVATDLAARGLDVKGIDLVINFSIAQSGDDHLHRIGRTGRAGEDGMAVTLVNSSEWNQMSSIERYLKFRFTFCVLSGLKASYTGPKKLKKSGKAAGTKKKKSNTKLGKKQPGKAKIQSASEGQKNKARKSTSNQSTKNQSTKNQSSDPRFGNKD